MMLSALAIAFALATPAPVPTPQSLPQVTLHAPAAVLRVQVARSAAQRERGLMGVTHLQRHTGMLFIFERDAAVAFWMKDTLIPLDMIFLGSDGAVRSVFANVPVVDPSLADSDIPLEQGTAKYVLELPAKEAQADGITDGVHITGLP